MRNLRKRIQIVKEIWPYLKKYRLQLILIFFLKLSLVIPSLLQPIIYRLFIDDVMSKKDISLMVNVVIFFLGLYLLETLLRVMHRIFDNYLFNSVTHNLKQIMFQKYMYMPIQKHKEFITSDLKNRIDFDVDMTKIFILNQVFDYITAFLKLLSSSLILLFFDWRIAIFCFLMLPFSILISNSCGKKLENQYEEAKTISNELEQTMQESIYNWKEIKANNFINWQCRKYNEKMDKQYSKSKTISGILIKRNTLINIKDSWLNQILIYIIGGILFFVEKITMGTVILGGQYYNNMYGALSELLGLDIGLENLKPSVYRVLEILSIKDAERIEDHSIINLKNDKNIITIKHLFYTYENNNKQILKGVDLTIDSKDKVLIYGESGGGKSTFLNILSGCLAPAKGNVFICNEDIIKIDHQILYQKMSIIYQEPYFMNLSIKEYILLANQNVIEEEIQEVCKRVGLLEFIQSLPEGFNTKIGEQGVRLSGGQKQRLAIARLLLTDKDIIILDESLSAIDAHDKIIIMQEIIKQFHNKTIICISHDQSVSKFFNKKFRLAQGVLKNG